MAEAPVLLTRWELVLGELLDRTAKFPKVWRFTLTQRIDGLALDVLQHLVRARFATGRTRATALADADLALAQMRVLLRLAHARSLLDHRGYEHLSRHLDECGRMLGGWRQSGDHHAP
jgi:hypothetical protein